MHHAELLPRVRARRPPKPISFAPEGPQLQRKSARQLHPGGSVSHLALTLHTLQVCFIRLWPTSPNWKECVLGNAEPNL